MAQEEIKTEVKKENLPAENETKKADAPKVKEEPRRSRSRSQEKRSHKHSSRKHEDHHEHRHHSKKDSKKDSKRDKKESKKHRRHRDSESPAAVKTEEVVPRKEQGEAEPGEIQ